MIDWHNRTLIAGAAAVLIAGFGIGFFLSGGGFLLYAFATELYPSAGRATGFGFLVGASRLGAVAGPLLAGILLTADRNAGDVMLSLVPLIAIALIAALFLSGGRHVGQAIAQ